MPTENNVAAQAGDEPMRADFEREVLRLGIIDDEGLERRHDGSYVDDPAQAAWLTWKAAQLSPRATADVERVMMDCLIALSIGYVQTNDAGDEVCPDCDVDHVGADHSPGCLVLRARAARAQLAAIATTKPGA